MGPQFERGISFGARKGQVMNLEGAQISDTKATLRLAKDLKEAYVIRDLDRFVDFFADCVVCMPDGEHLIVGRAA